MHILKPNWLGHSEEGRKFQVYSVSVSSDGQRLASGGLDGKVRIWSTKAILNNAETGRQLCSASTHSGAVTVVRFSPNGKYLASGSDDSIVLIWERDETRAPAKEFGKTEADSETWIARRRLIGHESDVQDLAWAPDQSMLVTVGLDSGIIIWNGHTFEKIKRLDIHQSHVKGITFDPANKYFATASDDRTLKIVHYSQNPNNNDITFGVESTITDPFKGSPLSTYFRRCSWSPDGSHIAVANSTNGPVSTVAIVNRGSWKSDISLIGHEAPCEVASFCPRMFSLTEPGTVSTSAPVSVIASAAQDNTLAIWNTASSRPLLVAKNIADKAITDISWSADGSMLFASSLDSTISLVAFDKGELGYPISRDECESQLARYGATTLEIPEGVEQVRLEETINKDKMGNIMGSNEELPGATVGKDDASPTVTASSGASTNVNTLTQSTTNSNLNPNPTATSAANVKDSSTLQNEEPASTGDVEMKDAPETNENTSNGNSVHNKEQKSANDAAPKAASRPAPAKVTITKDGKKRLAPTLVSVSNDLHQKKSTTTHGVGNGVSMGTTTLPVLQMSHPSHALPNGGVSTLIIGHKRKDTDGEDGEPSGAVSKKAAREETPEYLKSVVVNPASAYASSRLAVPRVRATFQIPCQDSKKKKVLEIRNSETGPSRLVSTLGGQMIFVDYLPRYIQLATGTESFWAVATDDGSLYAYSPTGRRLITQLVLEASLTFLESRGPYLLGISCVGMAYLWNLVQLKAVMAPVSLAPILDNGIKTAEDGIKKGPTISQAAVTLSGDIVITLTTGQGYTYDKNMLMWARISDSWWALGSQYWSSRGTDSLKIPSGVVGYIENRTNEEVVVRGGARGRQLERMARNRSLQEGYEGFETIVSIAHLENRISAAIMLNSSQELEQFLLMYAQRIASEGMKDRLDELCKSLLGPTDELLCGLKKHDLLKRIILEIGSIRQVQRVVNVYAEALGIGAATEL